MARRPQSRRAGRLHEDDDGWSDLTPGQKAEIRRRVKDARDPTRYLIISRVLPGARYVMYYNVSDDAYAYNRPEGGTLFKRRRAAELILNKLKRGKEIIEVKFVRGKILGATKLRVRSKSSGT